MQNLVITIGEKEAQNIEKAVLDHDIELAFIILTEIRQKIRAMKTNKCGIENLRKY